MTPTQVPGNAGGLQGQLLDVFLFLGSNWILYLLLLLSVISIAITFERLVHFLRQSLNVERLRVELSERLGKGDLSGATKALDGHPSHVSAIVRQGLAVLERGPAAVEEMMASATQIERLKMERGLAFLGTLGNNAPFIGLFGTVLGIIRSFRDLATNTIEGSSAVMAGIAEALVATAVGLLVALPAVALFNFFQRVIRKELIASEAMSRLLLSFAKSKKD